MSFGVSSKREARALGKRGYNESEDGAEDEETMKLFEQVLTVVTYVSISFTTIASTEHYLNQKKGSPLFPISLGLAVSSFVYVLKHFFFMQEAVDKGKLNL